MHADSLSSQKKFKYQKKQKNDAKSGQLYKNINGIKCFVKYTTKRDRCEVTVYTKIYAHPLEYTFMGINVNTFRPKAALRRL